jgi:4-hydroxy-2-oxoheptanedioate aldolase
MILVGDVRARWARAEAIVGMWAALPSPFSVEFVGVPGLDYICVDQQHGLVDHASMLPMLPAIQSRGLLPITRVPTNETWLIGRALDAGCVGVIVPMVSSAAEAARAVAACRYPPRGVRSYGPTRAALVLETADPASLEQVLCIVMVETAEGLANVDAIAATPGVDAVYVGPADLALALGLGPQLPSTSTIHANAVSVILKACHRAGIAAGIQCDNGLIARTYLKMGFQMVTIGKDSTLLRSAVLRELAAALDGPGRADPAIA